MERLADTYRQTDVQLSGHGKREVGVLKRAFEQVRDDEPKSKGKFYIPLCQRRRAVYGSAKPDSSFGVNTRHSSDCSPSFPLAFAG